MAPYMSEEVNGESKDSNTNEIQPSGIRVIIVGAGFAGITAAMYLNNWRFHTRT